MNDLGTEQEFFTILREDLETPCDYAEEQTCSQGPAHWVMHLVPCCSGLVQTLACDRCMDIRMTTEDGIECDRCGLVTVPARRAYMRIEHIG